MGRSSLDATKVLCSLMVRAAVDFLRGCPFLVLAVDGFFVLPVFAPELFFLVVEVLGGVVADELCAGKAPACSINPAKRVAITRVRDIVTFSLPRCMLAALCRIGCTFRFPRA